MTSAVSHERHDIVSLRLGVCDFGDRGWVAFCWMSQMGHGRRFGTTHDASALHQ
jgi:hypothetical protein